MWPDWTDLIPAAVAAAIITAAVGFYGHRQNRKTASETNKLAKETNEISEADMLIKNLSADVKALRERADKTDTKLSEQAAQIRQLQQSEWSLRRYVYRLLDRLKALGDEHPPEPPPGIEI